MMLRVRSARSVRNAVKLIDELMEKEGIALAKSYEDVDYAKEFKYVIIHLHVSVRLKLTEKLPKATSGSNFFVNLIIQAKITKMEIFYEKTSA